MYPNYPTANPVDDDYSTPTGVPTDDRGHSLIPELMGRSPTHNEAVLISGNTIAMASTNVMDIWWSWGSGGNYEPKLFVRFLSGDLYVYQGVTLTTAVAMIETASAGRFVWNYLRGRYPYSRLEKGTGVRRKPQVVRLVP